MLVIQSDCLKKKKLILFVLLGKHVLSKNALFDLTTSINCELSRMQCIVLSGTQILT